MKRKIYSPCEQVTVEVCNLTPDDNGGHKVSWTLWRQLTCNMHQVFCKDKRRLEFLLRFKWIPNFPSDFRIKSKRGEILYPVTMPLYEGFESIKCVVRKNSNV